MLLLRIRPIYKHKLFRLHNLTVCSPIHPTDKTVPPDIDIKSTDSVHQNGICCHGKQLADHHDLLNLRNRLIQLPLGNRLPADFKPLAKLLLGESQ